MPDALAILFSETFTHTDFSPSLESPGTFQGLGPVLAPPENLVQNPMPCPLYSPAPGIEIPAFHTPVDHPP